MKTTFTKSTLVNLLSGITRDDLRIYAKKMGVHVGKTRDDLEKNILNAIENQSVRLTVFFDLSLAPEGRNVAGECIHARKMHNYKDDSVIFPAQPVPRATPLSEELGIVVPVPQTEPIKDFSIGSTFVPKPSGPVQEEESLKLTSLK